MSKRLKYSKLRLVKSDSNVAAPMQPAAEQQSDANNLNTGENILRSCKKSKFFTAESCSQATFIENDDEHSDDSNKEPVVPNLRRRTQSEDVCSSDGPKLPKLRKKTLNGNGLISNFLNTQIVEDDDFEESRQNAVPQPKQTKVQRAAKKPKQPRKPKNQSDIRKIFKKYKSDYDVLHELIKDHSASEQVDPEQLQMALAMSRSLADQECSSGTSSSKETHLTSASSSGTFEERRIIGIRTTLEQFGFRCKNSYTDYDLNVIFGAGCKNVKKIKHKRATNLQLRTREELRDFIDRQTRKMFPNEITPPCTDSNALLSTENTQSCLSNLFWIAQTEQASSHLLDQYYVPELMEADPAPVGYLLKDWSKIPGRESTPERTLCETFIDGKVSLCQDVTVAERTVASPDLFNDLDSSIVHFNHLKDREKEYLGDCEEQVIEEQSLKQRTVQKRFNQSEVQNIKDTSSETQSPGKEQKDLDKDQASKSIPFVCGLTAHEVEGCEDNLKNQDIIAIESEDESSIVLDISAEVPIIHRSTENIFDESDMEPIVSFEVYSSEEEKISSKPHQEKPISKEDTQQPNQGAIASIVHEQFENTNPMDQPLVKSNSKCMEIAEIPQCAVVNDEVGECAAQSNRGEKRLSFNRIAIDARLSEALETGASRVETVDLVDYTPSVDETIENNDSRHENSIVDLPKSETVINEPIDEVPVDVNHHIEEINNDEEDILNETEIYYHHEPQKEGQVRQKTVIVQSQEPPCSNDELVCVSSDEFKVVDQPSNCAESTFVYLDNLVKQFNLPPLRLQKSNTNSLKSLSRDECSKATVSSQPLEKAVDKDGHVHFVSSPFVMDGTANDLEEDTNPHLRVDDAELEVIEPDEDSRGFSLAIQYQDNLNGLRERPNVILLPTGKTACSTKPACSQPKANRFEDKFSELKLMASPARCPEYLIGVKPFDFETPSYENMSTPQIERELFKYGLKDLNRPKAVRVLNHLFEATHMLVDVQERIEEGIEKENSSTITSMHSKAKVNSISPTCRPMNHVSQELSQNNPLLHPCPFKLDLGTDEVYLPLNPRKKIVSVPVPLHIAFFNLVSENVALQRSILLYQPIDLDEICSVLKEVGLRYETNDIIAFLDKLCITFRSTSSGVSRIKSNSKK